MDRVSPVVLFSYYYFFYFALSLSLSLSSVMRALTPLDKTKRLFAPWHDPLLFCPLLPPFYSSSLAPLFRDF